MILVLDVTGPQGRLAIGNGQEVTSFELGEKRHSENLLPEIERVVQQFGRPKQLGVVTGPGSFTGIRIGIASALGLATGWEITTYGLDHFSLMVNLAPPGAALAVPAGRNRFYLREGGKENGLPKLVDGSELPNPVYGRHPGLLPLCLDPLSHFIQLIERNELQPSTFIQGFYAKAPDAIRGASLLEKLLQR